MTDKEFKRALKKLGIILILIFIVVIILAGYIFNSTKAQLSIYSSSEDVNSGINLEINEEELKEYLSIFGNLIKDNSDDVKTLDIAVDFINNMCTDYEIQINEVGQKYYSSEIISQITKELQGKELNESMDITDSNYTYDESRKIYILQNEEIEQIPCCIQIDNILTEKENEIEVTYELALLSSEQLAQYLTEQKTNFEVHKIKAIILKNDEYEYSKYCISSIEKI